jgi:hypothetical protein
MDAALRDREPPELQYFKLNRSCRPRQQLAPYAGRHVAWSLDGTQILASGGTLFDVVRNVTALGLSLSFVVVDYIEPAELATLV